MENPKISVGILNSEEIQFELFGYYFFEQANKIVKGKFKAKKVDEKINVKVIKGYRSEIGTIRFLEKFVKVDTLDQINNLDISK